jgi:hypothetical protein
MTKLQEIDIAFSFVREGGLPNGDGYTEEGEPEGCIEYPDLQSLTLRYAPCKVLERVGVGGGGTEADVLEENENLLSLFGEPTDRDDYAGCVMNPLSTISSPVTHIIMRV